MVYQETFDLFAKESPVTVMLRGMMENIFSAQRLDELFRENAVPATRRPLAVFRGG